MRASHLNVLIALLDAVRREDRDGLLGLMDLEVVWRGLGGEPVCRGAEEVVAALLERAAALDDVDHLELEAFESRVLLHLRGLTELEDTPLPDGLYLAFDMEHGRISRITDHAQRRRAVPAPEHYPPGGIAEAPLESADAGLVPRGDGWFVLNVRDAKWMEGPFGAYTRFEGDVRFPRFGINVGVLAPGQPSAMYHREDEQEDFLVLAGECLLIVEERERKLRPWDFVHCPPWTNHIFVGAGDGPCTLLAVGGRASDAVVYPRSDVALRHGAGVERATHLPDEAYAPFDPDRTGPFRDEWLPG